MPEKKKTTMSVTEMRKLLGLKKTDSYWLVHKNCFETVMVNGKMRIVIDSFEKWYANQIKHKKVVGPPPGEELKAYSYSVRDIAQLLSIDETSVYYLIKRDHIPTFKVETWTRIRKDDFEKSLFCHSPLKTYCLICYTYIVNNQIILRLIERLLEKDPAYISCS